MRKSNGKKLHRMKRLTIEFSLHQRKYGNEACVAIEGSRTTGAFHREHYVGAGAHTPGHSIGNQGHPVRARVHIPGHSIGTHLGFPLPPWHPVRARVHLLGNSIDTPCMPSAPTRLILWHPIRARVHVLGHSVGTLCVPSVPTRVFPWHSVRSRVHMLGHSIDTPCAHLGVAYTFPSLPSAPTRCVLALAALCPSEYVPTCRHNAYDCTCCVPVCPHVGFSFTHLRICSSGILMGKVGFGTSI
ncbi:hypothetical protein ACH5RR_016189 [Cinchona calisaya]|uniref:Uncharacterized protein n=1 Tax=Cinchona calisaya TaxID=153742 RepID=A0ABD2ZV67_9GENT